MARARARAAAISFNRVVRHRRTLRSRARQLALALALDSAASARVACSIRSTRSRCTPPFLGRGYASSLVRAAFALGDRDGLPVTVECAGERMEALYTHLGFEKHAQAAVDDPTNQTKKLAMVSMVRLPRSAAPAAQ